MKRQVIAIFESDYFTLDGVTSNDARTVSEYVDDWSRGDLSLGLPLEVVAYEVCDTHGDVQGIAVVVEDFE